MTLPIDPLPGGDRVTTPNPRQLEAITHHEGPLQVVAGPGTGKTRVITDRVVHLTTQRGIKPDRILALTFTEKAAEEMAGRIRGALTKAGVKGAPTISTFHAFCLNVIEEHPERVGFDAKPKLLVGPLYVQFIAENIDSLVTDNTDLVGKTNAFAASVARFIGLCHDERIIGPDLVNQVDAWIKTLPPKDQKSAKKVRDIAASIPILLELQRKQNVVSYGDLLTLAVKLLEENDDIRETVAGAYDYVLVDEYQDNNRAQSDLVRVLAEKHRNITVVGDEDQSIYRFRGARTGIMREFLDTWKGPDGSPPKVVTLEENYRSTPAIIDTGQVLIKHNAQRPEHKALRRADKSTATGADKTRLVHCDTDSTERAYILQEIRRMQREGRALGEIAILVRSLAHASMLIAEVRQAGIGVEVVGGGGLFSNPVVREVLAWLKALHNTESEEVALHRLIRLQGFGLRHEDQRALGRAARERRLPLMALMQAARAGATRIPHFSSDGYAAIRGFVTIHDKFVADAKVEGRPDVSGIILEILDLTGLGRRLKTDNAEDRQSLAALGGLLQAADNYQQHFPYPSLHGFVQHLDLLEELGHDDTVGVASNDAGTVKIMTVHQSKGREFPVVFVHNLHRYPPDNRREWDRKFLDHLTLAGDVETIHMEEERRVLFVATTRAISELHITLSEARADGKANEASPYQDDFAGCALIEPKHCKADDIESPGAAAGAYRTRRAQEARLTYLVSRLGSHAGGAHVDDTLQECISLVSGLLADGAEGGVAAVERALKTLGIALPPEVRYLEPDKPKGLVGPLFLSASNLNLYAGCPRQFYYKHVVRIPEAASFEARLGTAIHAALEEFHRRHAKPTSAHFDELAELFEVELSDVQFQSEKEKAQGIERGRNILRLYLAEEAARGTSVEHVEKEFTVSLAEDVTLTGKIDRIDRLPDGKIRVVDYKSGKLKSRPDYLDDFQMPIYAWAVQEHIGEKLDSVEVIGLKEIKELKDGPTLERAVLPWEDGSKYALTAERIEEVKKRVADIIAGIREGHFEPVPEERRCGWCRYNLLCSNAWGVAGEEVPRNAPARETPSEVAE